MEMLTHVRSVWNSIFKRELLDSGRPIPGCSFSFTPRSLSLCGVVSEEDICAKLTDAPFDDALLDLVESWDLEARTLHALRLEKRWKAALAESKSADMKFGRHPVSLRSNFHAPFPVHDLFLLPGGRFAVTVHKDRLQCWDLSFPHELRLENESNDALVKTSPAGRCVGEWVFPKGIGSSSVFMDEGSHSTWKGDNSPHIAICADSKLTWG